MSNYYSPPQPGPYGGGDQNLQFYPSSYSPAVGGGGMPLSSSHVSGHATPAQASYGGYAGGGAAGFGTGAGFGGHGVTGRMGESGGLRTGWKAAFSTEGYPGEPPLLEELGINLSHIQAKTLAVLNPFRHVDQHLMDDSDLAGPLLSFFLFGTFLLFSGKVHFGYIYGLAVIGSTSLHFILSLMSPDDGSDSAHPLSSHAHAHAHAHARAPSPPVSTYAHPTDHHLSPTLTFARSTSVLGYCLLPLVATSIFGIVMPMDTAVGIAVTSVAILWCTSSASGIFCAVGRMRGMRGLVAYPLALFYVGFGIISVFSSRGSSGGAPAK